MSLTPPVATVLQAGIDLHSQAAAYHRAVAWFDPRTEAHDAQGNNRAGLRSFRRCQMRIIAFITHSADIRQILAHMRLNFLSVFMDGTAGRAAGLPLAQPSQC